MWLSPGSTLPTPLSYGSPGAGADPALAVPSTMADLPVGAGFGTLVHAVLEAADLTAPDLGAELAACVHAELDRHPTPTVDPDALAAALVPVARTPLGPLGGGRALADLAPRDRLAELDFELPLAGGDSPGPAVVLGDLVPLLRRHLGPDDPLAAYPDRLAPLADQPLRGYLTGSIDAVLRMQDPERYLVVDYKTNWLGPVGPDGREPLTAGHYTPERLADAMLDAHYPLQALLYAAALHRFLRWRLRGYAPERHLGGVLYLFLRGMCGPDGPVVDGVPCGVFSWRPPAALVVELSGLLGGMR
jgi:exodeoxyribonuclease V beta subunit